MVRLVVLRVVVIVIVVIVIIVIVIVVGVWLRFVTISGFCMLEPLFVFVVVSVFVVLNLFPLLL